MSQESALKRLRTNEALEEDLRIANLRLEAADKLLDVSIDMSLANDGIFDCYGGLIVTRQQITKAFDAAIKEYTELSK